jgi:hypothetical protein
MWRNSWVYAVAGAVSMAIYFCYWSLQGGLVPKAHAYELSRPTMAVKPEPQAVSAEHGPARVELTTLPKRSHQRLANARRVLRPHRLLLVPPNCGADGHYDLLLHFHGAAETMEPIFRTSDLDAVVVITNLGLASGPYEDLFTGRNSFQIYLDALTSELRSYCPNAKLRRLALSSWSAGYGAAIRILEHERNRERIDAILLADGLHGGLEHRHPRIVRAAALEPINRFAEQAARGERLLALTHTGIVTPDYASTTETANFLLTSQGLKREEVDLPGPRPKMRLRSTAHQAGLWVSGYDGANADAHCDHLFAFGKTLLPVLEARWNQ